MKIIHFCSYFVGSKVYINLFKSLANNGCSSIVYVPCRNNSNLDKNLITHGHIDYVPVPCLSVFTRVFYSLKLLLIFFYYIFNSFKFKGGESVHAHTLYADGIPAFLCSFINKLPFIITVRNTDVNLGFKYYLQYKFLAKLALRKAKCIVFISHAHKGIFQAYFGSEFNGKIHVIPNGIDDYYISNSLLEKKMDTKLHALYVGQVNKNKNLYDSIEAFSILNGNTDWVFTIVGGDKKDFLKVYGRLPCNEQNLIFIPSATQDELIGHYDSASIFIMVSHTETFGLVYLEAISRCLPVVYTKGQGIDGYFENGEVGFFCHSKSKLEIVNAINFTMKKFNSGLKFNSKNVVVNYSWQSIAIKHLVSIYK
ncbi:glycosyltransferase family 4 protein [Shewanella baltica]|uniref:glycosyltransferase family 4 protein n=1 Tax=Shewanella baltica TaxID=62322 RepID=UPI002871B632|nr:glycosyltransferase family 4 protein [Shewanella baltica]MDR9765629.1 glycosyltransferase family 4 protein [Shewanella baltica]